MGTAGVYRALLLKNTSFQLRQVKTNVFQIIWIVAQMAILVFIGTRNPPDNNPYTFTNTYSLQTTPQAMNYSYGWGYQASNYWSNIFYLDNPSASDILAAMSRQGNFTIYPGYQNLNISWNSSCPVLTRASSQKSILNTYSEVGKELQQSYNKNQSYVVGLLFQLPTASLEFKTVDASTLSYTMGVSPYSPGPWDMPNSLNNNDDTMETVQNIVANSLLMDKTGQPFSIVMSSQQFNYTYYGESTKEFFQGFVCLLGLFFIPSVIIFIIPVFVYTIVNEKQEKIVEMMKMMGINMPTYWIANYIFCVFISLIMAIIVMIIGYVGQIPMFTKTEPMAFILLFVLNSFAQVSFSFLISTLFSKARTSVLVTYFFVMIFCGLGSMLQMIVFKTGSAPFVLLLIPPFALQRGVYMLSYWAAGPAPKFLISLSEYSPLSQVLVYLFLEAIVYLIVAVYLDLVMPRENGVSYSPFFPITALINKIRQRRKGPVVLEEQKPILANGAVDEAALDDIEHQLLVNASGEAEDDLLSHAVEFEDEDCVRERRKVHSPAEFLVKIIDLHKVYPGRAGQPAKNALVKFCLGLETGECLGLLGPNGAGKTSLISMLCGLSVPTSGTALISGFSITDEMYKVHQILGYCPQHDILWQDLTIEEHLLFYCRLKGYNKANEVRHVREIAASVGLEFDMHKKVSQLSGGMKRRLSISIALVGDSRLVLLDEPTTGLDPDTRRNVWDIINAHKAKRSIIITTHNIDEADVLCSKIAIMSLGSLKCIGTALYLKNKFGAGYKLSAHVTPGGEEEYKKWVKNTFKQAELDPSAGTIDFIIPAANMDVSYVFSIMKRNKEQLGILEWAISQMSLEEVFLAMVAHDESQF